MTRIMTYYTKAAHLKSFKTQYIKIRIEICHDSNILFSYINDCSVKQKSWNLSVYTTFKFLELFCGNLETYTIIHIILCQQWLC